MSGLFVRLFNTIASRPLEKEANKMMVLHVNVNHILQNKNVANTLRNIIAKMLDIQVKVCCPF